MKKRSFSILVSVFFVTLTLIGTAPLQIFYMIEGGGGGGTVYPKTWTHSVTIPATTDAWNSNEYYAYSQIETDDCILNVRLWVSSKNQYAGYEMIEVSTAYTYKGNRDQPGVIINGEILAARIEVEERTYTTCQEVTWQTSTTARQCWPRDYDANGPTGSWSTIAKIGTGAAVSLLVYLSPLTGGTSALAGLAINSFITLMRDSAAQFGGWIPDNTGLTSDPTGYYLWSEEMPASMMHYYGGSIGYQHAFDFESHNQIRHGWTSSAKGKTLQLRFRVVGTIQDLSTGSDEITLYSPWTYINSAIEGVHRPPGGIIR